MDLYQDPDPTNVSTWSCIFVKSVKARCFAFIFLKTNPKLYKLQALKNPDLLPDPSLQGWIPGSCIFSCFSFFFFFNFLCHQVILMHSQVWKSQTKGYRLISLMSLWLLGSISFWSFATIDWDVDHITLCSLEKADNWQHLLPHCSDESHNPLCRVINYPFVCPGCSDRVLFNKEGREFGHNINSC